MADEAELNAQIRTPLPDGTFYLRRLSGIETVSGLFEFRLELMSAEAELDFTRVLGQSVSLDLAPGGETVRTFAGIAARFGQIGVEGHYTVYELVMVPWAWLLTRSAGCDIFHETSVQEIVKEVLRRAPQPEFELPTSGWTDRNYCVQYRETDWAFVARLLEDEGFYWYFEPDGEYHRMVVVDGSQSCETFHEVRFTPTDSHEQDIRVTEFRKVQELTPGSYEMVDFDYADPKLGEPMESVPSSVDVGSAPSESVWYDFPGEFAKVSGGDTGKLRDRVRLRIAEEDARAITFRGKSRIMELMAGHGLRMTECYREDFDGDYLVTEIRHELEMTGGLEAGAGGSFSYTNEFECVPDGVRYVPRRKSPRPRIRGVHTAIVKDAIDGQGRVRVSFPWCKDKLSCWIRVAQTWAGGGWGAQFHPRVGHEVIVDFFEGDPDLPLVTGRVYNGENEGPYSAKHSQGGVKSRSMEGNPDNFNEIRFEDEKGNEELFFHAEKDHVIEVENDESKSVGANRSENVQKNVSIQIGGDRTEAVTGNRSLSVSKNKTEEVTGDKNITVSKAHSESIGGEMTLDVRKSLIVNVTAAVGLSAGKALSVSAGSDTTMSSKGSLTAQVDKAAALTIKEGLGAEAKEIQIEAKDQIVLKVGSASITMKKNGDIVIDGGKIDVKGSGDVKIKGSKTGVN